MRVFSIRKAAIQMELKPATHNSLGGIKIGDGFKITEEGVLTVDEDYIQPDEYVEFTRERLEEIFSASKSRGLQ